MKKKALTFITFFGLLTSSVVHAQPAYSNIVGMVKTALPSSGFRMVSLQFSGTKAGVTLGDAFTGLSDNSKLYLWSQDTGSGFPGYVVYRYLVGPAAWFTQSFGPADDVIIPRGTVAFIQDGGTGSDVVHSGSVPSVPNENFYDVSFVGGSFNMVGNPYPVETPFSAITSANFSDFDTIYIFDGSDYILYRFITAATAGAGEDAWYTSSFGPTTGLTIAPGTGFWLSTAQSGSIRFNKTY